MDVNNSKKITFDSLKKVAGQVGENVSDEDLRDIIAEADLDKDGGLSLEEFKAYYTIKQPNETP